MIFEGRTPAPTAGAVSKPPIAYIFKISFLLVIAGFDTAAMGSSLAKTF